MVAVQRIQPCVSLRANVRKIPKIIFLSEIRMWSAHFLKSSSLLKIKTRQLHPWRKEFGFTYIHTHIFMCMCVYHIYINIYQVVIGL